MRIYDGPFTKLPVSNFTILLRSYTKLCIVKTLTVICGLDHYVVKLDRPSCNKINSLISQLKRALPRIRSFCTKFARGASSVYRTVLKIRSRLNFEYIARRSACEIIIIIIINKTQGRRNAVYHNRFDSNFRAPTRTQIDTCELCEYMMIIRVYGIELELEPAEYIVQCQQVWAERAEH